MTIAFINLGSSGNPDFNISTDLTGYSGTSWTPPTYGVIGLFVCNRVSGNDTPIPVGNNIVWYRIASSMRVEDTLTFFVGDPTNSTTGFFGVNFTGSAQAHCEASLFHISGSYTGHGVTGTIAQFQANDSGSGLSLSIGLTNSTGTTGNSRPIAGFEHRANEGTSARANWVEVDDMSGASPNRGFETQWKQSAFEGTASASWASSSVCIGLALEVLDAADFPTSQTYEVSVSIGEVDSVSPSSSRILNTVISLAEIQDVLTDVVRQMGVTLNLGEKAAITIDELLVSFVTKGFVAVLDFAQNPVAVLSFANTSSASDSAASASSSDTKANTVSTDDSASSAEASDI